MTSTERGTPEWVTRYEKSARPDHAECARDYRAIEADLRRAQEERDSQQRMAIRAMEERNDECRLRKAAEASHAAARNRAEHWKAETETARQEAEQWGRDAEVLRASIKEYFDAVDKGCSDNFWRGHARIQATARQSPCRPQSRARGAGMKPVWQPVINLRYTLRENKLILQQAWVLHIYSTADYKWIGTDKYKWVDIPTDPDDKTHWSYEGEIPIEPFRA